MKMPASVGTKKAKAVEQLLEELGVGMSYHYCLRWFKCYNLTLTLFFNALESSVFA